MAGGQADCAKACILGGSRVNLTELYSSRCIDYSLLTIAGAQTSSAHTGVRIEGFNFRLNTILEFELIFGVVYHGIFKDEQET